MTLSQAALPQNDLGVSPETQALRNRLRESFWPANRSILLLLTVAVAVCAILRLIRLMSLLPVLVDEAIYLRWAEIIQHQHTWFVSLLDAKPPLIYWLYAALRFIVPNNPLVGNRLVSVVAGALCTLLLYRVAYLCAGFKAGLVAAFLYAVLPFAVVYDRIAYVDSVVNLCGVGLVYASLSAFGEELSWRRTLETGVFLGLGLFVKTTILLFAFAPIAIALYLQRRDRANVALHLVAIYAVASLFPLWSQLSVPLAPTFPYNNMLFHHTSFFTPLPILLHDPLADLRFNIPLLGSYAAVYIGSLTLIAALIALLALVIQRNYLPVLIFLVCTAPLVLVLTCLEYFPSRYVFPIVWPLLLVIACACAFPVNRRSISILIYFLVASVTASMFLKSLQIVENPDAGLHERDADEFLGQGPYSGSGVLEAIAMLRDEGRNGPITILTDPWWGPPTDVVFAYLNEVDGIRVYEAWWLQLEAKYPLVPSGSMPVWKSQYERVAAADVDFSTVPRLYYITDTDYHTPEEVHAAAPSARLLRRFQKRNGSEYIDVYRLH